MPNKKLNAKSQARLLKIMKRGHGLEKHQRLDETAIECQKALDIDRDNVHGCLLPGMVRHKQGRNEIAEPLPAKF